MKAEEYMRKAIEIYGSDDITFDVDVHNGLLVSESEDGAFIQAWVWVYKDDLEEEL